MNESEAINVEHHRRLVHRVAKRYRWALTDGLKYEDLEQTGALGLIEAAKRFDPALGYKFSTYAMPWVVAYIRRAVEDTSRTIRVPSWYRRKVWREGGKLVNHGLSLDTGYGSTAGVGDDESANESSPMDRVVDECTNPEDLENAIDDRRQSARVRVVMRQVLNKNQLEAMTWLYVEGLSLQATGRRMGCTREWVRQLEKQSLALIRKAVL